MLINDDDKVVGNVTQTNEGKAKTKLQKILGKIVGEKIKKMCGAKSLEDTAYPFRKNKKYHVITWEGAFSSTVPIGPKGA
ncbi:hypothetical protein I6G77_27975 (plasmid) [Bacillus tropicus]|uniref:Uncharacterized protein n=1 Tax=Bacillus tropicus TaxID=2026188 RepID=A0A7T2QKZ0_9BACI|nr:hypothetical protein [Bacillus tropicus]AJG91329.1 hypothetical protein BG03_5684 [Bacillus cereus]QPR80653.1 hypothetical protein I6G77_27975 [Bacillus tropicus]